MRNDEIKEKIAKNRLILTVFALNPQGVRAPFAYAVMSHPFSKWDTL